MFFLLLRILFSTSFSHLLRLSQARTRRPMAAVAINYLLAALACGAWTLAEGVSVQPRTAVLGACAGTTYVSSLLLLLPAMRESGVSVVGAVTQLSMMVPVATSVWRFREYPSAPQTAGIALTLFALPLLSAASAVRSSAGGKGGPLTVGLFLSSGLSQVVMKEFSATRPAHELPLYSAALFAAATLFTWLWMIRTGDTGRPEEDAPQRSGNRVFGEWPIGFALGCANVLQLVCLLIALRSVPAVVAFPVSAILGILFNLLASMLLWKERPPPAGWLGIGLAVVAVALLSKG